MRFFCLFLSIAFAASNIVLGQVTFQEMGWELHFRDLDPSAGVAIVDLDEDGISEIITTSFDGPDRLYKWADTIYIERGALYGLTQDADEHHSICLTDIDKDRRPDFFITGDPVFVNHGHLYINNGHPPFPDMAEDYNLDQVQEMGSSFFQFTPTSELAVLCGGRFMVRQGDTFIDITQGSGLESIVYVHEPLFFDIDGDYDDDLVIVGNWEDYPARMYRNNGDTTWTDISTNTNQGGFPVGQGVIFGDIDNDGDFDIYIVSGFQTNTMWENDGTGFFTNVTAQSNTGVGGYSRGTCFADFDNDTDIDLYINRSTDYNMLFLNNGNGVFTDYSYEAGTIHYYNGGGCASGDFNNDGNLDIFAVNCDNQRNLAYINQNQDSSFLKIRMMGDYPNYMAFGAIVELYGITEDPPDTVFIGKRQVASLTAVYSVNDPVVHFGTGDYTELRVVAVFNSLYTVDVAGIAPGRTIVIYEHTTSIDYVDSEIPSSHNIINAYPNPFNSSVRISINDKPSSYYTLAIYDILGRLIKFDNAVSDPSGKLEYIWDGSDHFSNPVSSGIFFIRVAGKNLRAGEKVTLLK
ncbi:MAG: T9SS type A sorting domain-containing protein [Candidatus Zixiibacteriota bacterium]|nr:MAG: T9SS type A sorting domain-containing protein [candidate division Zixibacteria bacterium]